MSWRLDRRRFLRDAVGPILPLPFLNLMERKSSGAVADAPPIRFMTLFKPNGVHPPSWTINGGTEFDFRMSPLMQPFAKHKQDLLILDFCAILHLLYLFLQQISLFFLLAF